MKKWDGKSKGNALGYQCFVSLLRVGGPRLAYFLLYFVSFFFFLSLRSQRRHLYSFYSKLGFSKSKRVLSTYKNFIVLGKSMIDRIAVMSGNMKKVDYTFEGEDHLKEMIDRKQGGFLIGAHMGNWNLAGFLLKRVSENTKIYALIYDEEKEAIKKYLGKVCEKNSIEFIAIKNDMSHIFKIAEVLGNNHLICVLADRYMPGSQTISQDFFEEEAFFPEGVFRLVQRTKVPVTFTYTFREGFRKYHLFATPLKEYSSDRNLKQIVADYSKSLEDMVRKYPLQWFNYYNFWEKN
ncbi:MAG: hypothetical protein ACEPOW_10355 [Bacteroidales bacterium]